MKTLILIALLLPMFVLGNEIDSLKNTTDVKAFFIKQFGRGWKKDFGWLLDSTTQKGKFRFYKIDIDKNGLTDLIINSSFSTFMILDKGHKQFSWRQIDRGVFSHDQIIVEGIETAPIPKIFISHKNIWVHNAQTPEKLHDTLVYKFGGLVEYNVDTLKENFTTLTLETTNCWGKCPVFTLKINGDGTANYEAKEYADRIGSFHTIIPKADMERVIALVRYINPFKLNSSYTGNWSDDQTAITVITSNEKTKKIEDYGEIGSFGLTRLYELLFSWRQRFNWTNDDQPDVL